MPWDIVDVRPTGAPFIGIKDVVCVGGGEPCERVEQRILPIAVCLHAGPVREAGAFRHAEKCWAAAYAVVVSADCYPHLVVVFLGEVHGVDPGVAVFRTVSAISSRSRDSRSEAIKTKRGATHKWNCNKPSISLSLSFFGIFKIHSIVLAIWTYVTNPSSQLSCVRFWYSVFNGASIMAGMLKCSV